MNLFPSDRRTRRPKHNFATESHVWEIQPILVAPVLPGETLDHMTLQSRVVTPPVKSPVVGYRDWNTISFTSHFGKCPIRQTYSRCLSILPLP